MPFADLGDVRLFYTDDAASTQSLQSAESAEHVPAPGRDPLLLVHGFAADSQDWAWHIEALRAAGHRVIAADLRGHGASSAPETGYRPEDLAGDLARLLDHLGVERVVAFGHSMGGMVVTALAHAHPERVRGLLCVDPAYGQPAEVAAFFPAMVDALGKDPHATVLGMEPVLYVPSTPRSSGRRTRARSSPRPRTCSRRRSRRCSPATARGAPGPPPTSGSRRAPARSSRSGRTPRRPPGSPNCPSTPPPGPSTGRRAGTGCTKSGRSNSCTPQSTG
ncbi:alpha/beta fold hydrolase [Actinomadura yumaensis]|uniref:alpha/beta fold hydrolase n=1 Tax=Actinomadura yumaensis TaxID=111807 RepID=UPI00361FDDD1